MPPPPKRTRRRSRPGILQIASGVVSFILVAALAALVTFGAGVRKLDEPGPLAEDKKIFIARGTGTVDAIEKLEAEKVIDNGWLFSIGLKLSGGHIKFGEYRFAAHASARQVMAILTEGKPLQHTVTLPEGLTSQQIVQRLKDLKDEDGNDLLIGDVHVPPEGSLMPNTYKFSRGDSRESIIKRMTTAQRTVLDEIWRARDPSLPIRSSYDLVTLASIVEKETGKADERPMVAGVFVNRLNKRMKLQSDPTIIYGLVGGQGPLGRPLRRSEIDKPTPYNTYTIEGLPPGPIANPGRAAMEAVARPAKTRALYFVADGTGGHAFSETIAEHLRNVARLRQLEKEARDKDKLPEADRPVETPRPDRPPRRTEYDGVIPRDMVALYSEPDAARGTAAAKKPRGTAPKKSAAKAAPQPIVPRLPTVFAGPSDATWWNEPSPATRALAYGDLRPTPPAADPGSFEVGALAIDVGPTIEQRGWKINGADPEAQDDPSGALAQGEDAPSNGSTASYPMSPGMLADLRARQKKYAAADDLVPDGPKDAVVNDVPAGRTKVALLATRIKDCGTVLPPGQRPVAFDASEGTRLDPLRNNAFDLNSPKIVPEAVVKLVTVFNLGPSQLRRTSLGDGDCPTPTQTAEQRQSTERVRVASLAEGAGPFLPRPSRGFDASEGTQLDPLRNHAYDLEAAQLVPKRTRAFDLPPDLFQPLPDPPSKRLAVAALPAHEPGVVPAPTAPGASSKDPDGKKHGFDASAGTKLDPLLNKAWDLNSAQTVPTRSFASIEAAARAPATIQQRAGKAKAARSHGRRAAKKPKAQSADDETAPPDRGSAAGAAEGSKI